MHKERGNLSVRLLSTLGLILLLIILVAYFFYGLQSASMNSDDSTAGLVGSNEVIKFQIEKGVGVKEIAKELSNESLIRSIMVFKFYTLISGTAQKFQPGVYELSVSMSVPEIVRALTTPKSNEVQITITEGMTLKDTRELLISVGVWKKEEQFTFDMKKLRSEYKFLDASNSLEGFIFPDTYRIALDATPDEIVRVFLDNFKLKAWPLLESKNDWYQTLILASLLEREVPKFADRQIVAGILLKRNKIKMPLQVDATIGYAKCGGLLKNCELARITKVDTALASPYNTYKQLGWPPTPISNPGEEALRAALTPKETNYLYYLSDKSGETLFSRTFDEHNIKRAKYL
ncbi:MAG: endolytic transglycosylase MltG [bacterium]